MTRITIAIPDDHFQKLEEIAARFQITAEDLLRVSLEEILKRPEAAFENAVGYVLRKNEELYRRLT